LPLIRVLIVDDSKVARQLIAYLLDADPAIQVVGEAANGAEALEALVRLDPDVITMDIHMPGMDGYEVTRKIMETRPKPIVIVTAGHDARHRALPFRAIQAGAVAMLEKPRGIGGVGGDPVARELVETVKAMAEVKVVRRRASKRSALREPVVTPAVTSAGRLQRVELVVIGASTGGPPVLQTIFSALPPDFPAPIIVVQHIASGFLQGLVEWLQRSVRLRLRIAMHGEQVRPGEIYMAPEGYQTGITRRGRLSITRAPAEHSLCPSASYLFRSAAEAYGDRALGILLTGMGDDGAAELLLLRRKGAVTVAQDKGSSAVHGMPGAAIALGAARHVLDPPAIARLLRQVAARGVRRPERNALPHPLEEGS
jgi:two-component system chemotaxis response regulator CheB